MKRLISKIRAQFSARQASSSHSMVLLDGHSFEAGSSVADSRRQDPWNLIRQVGAFAQREGLTVRLVLTGNPLPRLSEGSRSHGVQVQYARHRKDLLSAATAGISARDLRGCVLVTSDKEIEAAALAKHLSCMHPATLRKGLGSHGPAPDRERSHRRHSRESAPNREGSTPPAAPPPPRPEASEKDDILDLIDPL